MTENEETNLPSTDETVLWMFDSVTFSHMDEIPDEHLVRMLEDTNICGQAMCIMVAGNFCRNTEDPFIFSSFCRKTIVQDRRLFVVFRSWLFLERARRIRKLSWELPDLLLKEMPYDETFMKSKSKEEWNKIKADVLETIKFSGFEP